MDSRAIATMTSAMYVGTATPRLMLSAPTSTPATKMDAATTPIGLRPASIAITMPL